MAVPLNHAYVAGGDDVCNTILDQVEAAADLVAETVQEHLSGLQGQMRGSMSGNPSWSGIANDLSMWRGQEGEAQFGFPEGSSAASEAFRLEYGDQTSPPDPQVRMGVLGNLTRMRQSMTNRFREEGF